MPWPRSGVAITLAVKLKSHLSSIHYLEAHEYESFLLGFVVLFFFVTVQLGSTRIIWILHNYTVKCHRKLRNSTKFISCIYSVFEKYFRDLCGHV